MRHGVARWARVHALYLLGGYPVADVSDSFGGVYRGVRFLSLGGGRGNFGICPATGVPAGDETVEPTDGDAAEVALLFIANASGKEVPWILQGVLHPDDTEAITDGTEAPEAGADYTAHHLTDVVLSRGVAQVVISELGGLVLRGAPVRVQLSGAETLRISSDGAAADGVLLAAPTLAYLDGLAAQVEAIRLAVILNGAAAPAVSYAGTTAALESATVALSAKAKG